MAETARKRGRSTSTPRASSTARSARTGPPARKLRMVARLHAYPPAHNAGAEWMVHPMLAALAARGHACEVHVSRWAAQRDTYEIDGVHVFPYGTHPRGRPDVLLTHLENVPPVGASARGLGVPLVVVMHNTLATSRHHLTAARPALTVLNSQWMASQLDGTPGMGETLIVRPPVLEADYRTTPGDCVTLVGLSAGKGGALFWDLARMLPGTPFLGVRGGYHRQIIPDEIPENVALLPNTDGRDMRDKVYHRTRVLIMGSEYESWGRVATEALCSGIPVIAHPAEGALSENLGKAAIWADRGDPETFAAEIKRLADPDRWGKASALAREQYKTLDPAGELAAWCAAVERLCAGPAPRPDRQPYGKTFTRTDSPGLVAAGGQ